MPTWTEMLGERVRGREKPLRMARGLEPLHAALPLACRLVLVGVLCTIIEIAILAMSYLREQLALSRSVALQFVSDDNARHDVERYVEEYMAAAGIGHKANETLLPHV